MALNATLEPMLIKERRVVMTKVIMTALRGIFQPGFTYKEGMMLVRVLPMPKIVMYERRRQVLPEHLHMKRKKRKGVPGLERRTRFGEKP